MSKLTQDRAGARGRHRTAAALLTLLTAASLTACDGMLDVELPGEVAESDLNTPAMARAVLLGGVADFECAFSEYILSTGTWADEFMGSAGWREVNIWVARTPDYEAGTGQCANSLFRGNFQIYLPLQIARNQAQNAYRLIEGFDEVAMPDRTELLGKAAAFAGYATIHLGEGYCEMRLDPDGPIITPAEVLEVAADWFETAIQHAQAANDDAILNLARVGRARALNYIGQKQEAAALASQVPVGFRYDATYSTTSNRRVNFVHLVHNVNHAIVVDTRYRNLTVDGVPDPRVPVTDMQRFANDGTTPLWVQEKYTELSSPIPIATWQEAVLIVAEAHAHAGNGPQAVASINQLRDHYGLPRFESNDIQEIRDQVIEERRRQLFIQGHRIGDMIRFGLPFDTGLDHKGVAYTDGMTCMPLPNSEL